jgi:hypothetical protein
VHRENTFVAFKVCLTFKVSTLRRVGLPEDADVSVRYTVSVFRAVTEITKNNMGPKKKTFIISVLYLIMKMGCRINL